MNDSVKKCGIITYHAAYNFGSVLQAYAIQEWLLKKGYYPTIINYRMKEQKKVYSIIRKGEGIKGCIKDFLSISSFKYKFERKRRFEQFISSKLLLTDEFSDPLKMNAISNKFDILISGSDQIWNKHSNELHNVDWKYMNPYLLHNIHKKKISYASSVGNMNDKEELKKLCGEIINFRHISMREKSGAEKIQPLIPNKIKIVLDPTFLLTKDEWINCLSLKKEKRHKYVLFYSLAGRKTLGKIKGLLNELIEEGYYIHYITPYNYGAFIKNKKAVNYLWYGPKDFIEAIYNADLILTDSYHGTILSINMGKQVFSINGEYASDYRKTDVLDNLGILSHSITWDSHINEMKIDNIDYLSVGKKLNQLRKFSQLYLINSIEK